MRLTQEGGVFLALSYLPHHSPSPFYRWETEAQ